MSGITTHILDVSRGLPAPEVTVKLDKEQGGVWLPVKTAKTDADGRARLLGPDEEMPLGNYRLSFEVEYYFAAQGIKAFYPLVEIIFIIRDDSHHHVPLLLSPFGYSTYRGS